MKKPLIAVFAVLLAASAAFVVSDFAAVSELGQYRHVRINEIMASNKTVFPDLDGDFCDWIEIYNAGDADVDLSGCVVADKNSSWTIGNRILPKKGFLLIWASGKDLQGEELHTDFKLKKSGELITLYAPGGKYVIDTIDKTAFTTDRSYGRSPDGSDNWYMFCDPTPGQSNENSKEILLDKPSFSHTGGFYGEPFALKLDAKPGAAIHYTLDGSEPSRLSPLYATPIEIRDRADDANVYSNIKTGHTWVPPVGKVSKATVVRAKAYDDAGNVSDVATQTFFVGKNAYTLPVISLASDSDGLFSNETGIYVEGRPGDVMGNGNNFRFRGFEWERRASLEFFEPGGEIGFSTDVGLRIHGSGSTVMPLKTLSIYARSRYGDSKIKYPIFDDPKFLGKTQSFEHLLLKNGDIMLIGSYDLMGHTLFRDELLHRLTGGLNMCGQAYRPAVVFINGEYWGIHNIREHQDEDYLALNYGIDPARAILVKLRWGEYKSPDGIRAHVDEYLDFLGYIQNNDLKQQDKYDYVAKQADLENFTDYVISVIYACNTDWMWSNIYAWKMDTYIDENAPYGKDGKWRWFLFDMDFGFYLPFAGHNLLADAVANMPYLGALLENPGFKNRFVNRLADLLNSVFLPERVIETVNGMEQKIEPHMREHIDRWSMNESFAQWKQNVGDIREFARQRPDCLRGHVAGQFGLGGMSELTIALGGESGGSVSLNTLDISGYWKGIYFHDVPISVRAVPDEGYRFAKWLETGETSETLVFEIRGDMTLTPVFEKTG